MERVIITGANGFVGRYLVREMVRQGIGVTAIVRNGSGLADGLDAYVAVIETDGFKAKRL